MVRKKKRNDDFQVRKLNKPYPAYTSGDEVVDYQFSLTSHIKPIDPNTIPGLS